MFTPFLACKKNNRENNQNSTTTKCTWCNTENKSKIAEIKQKETSTKKTNKQTWKHSIGGM